MSLSNISAGVAGLAARLGITDPARLNALLIGAGGISVFTAGLASYVRYANFKISEIKKKAQEENRFVEDDRKENVKKEKPALDGTFIKRMKRLLAICIPSWKSKQTFLLIAQLVVLYARTMASILVAKLDGYIVQAIVSKNFDMFLSGLFYWMVLALPAVAINSAIRFLTGHLSLQFRSALVQHVHQKYMQSQVYYKVSNLDARIDNADQMITADVSKFCHALAALYSDVSKPVMDLILYTWQLWHTIGPYGPSLLMGFYFIVGGVLRYSSPPFGQLAAIEGSLEGIFRFCHSRLIQNAEEVAFYKGDAVEKKILDESYQKLKSHVRNQLSFKMPYAIIEAFTLKYVASALVYSINAAPVFLTQNETDVKSRTGSYMEARRMLLDMAAAIQRVMEAYKEVTELSGYAARVAHMLEVFDDVQVGKYTKPISEENKKLLSTFTAPAVVDETNDKDIVFEHVPIITPNGDVLVKDLNFHLKPGMHLLITGPNGCGKSSLFRTLGLLWPVLHGRLRKPKDGQVFYIPQRPYLSIGTFKEQIIYPHSVEEFKSLGGTDEHLQNILADVNLGYVLDREGGWGARRNWKDRLSGGEKQRVGLARLFYHRPTFAILDECTSQVSIDWEGKMYTRAQELGITLLTVSHRPSLWKYHNFVLQFDGSGGVDLVTLNQGHRMSLEQEKSNIEHQLSEMPKLEKRLQEILDDLKKKKEQ